MSLFSLIKFVNIKYRSHKFDFPCSVGINRCDRVAQFTRTHRHTAMHAVRHTPHSRSRSSNSFDMHDNLRSYTRCNLANSSGKFVYCFNWRQSICIISLGSWILNETNAQHQRDTSDVIDEVLIYVRDGHSRQLEWNTHESWVMNGHSMTYK